MNSSTNILSNLWVQLGLLDQTRHEVRRLNRKITKQEHKAAKDLSSWHVIRFYTIILTFGIARLPVIKRWFQNKIDYAQTHHQCIINQGRDLVSKFEENKINLDKTRHKIWRIEEGEDPMIVLLTS
jgi:hypothetical protein